MRSRKNSELIGLLLLALVLSACGSKGCYVDMNVKLYANFYDSTGQAVSVKELTVQGVGSDSVLYSNSTLSGLELDLDPNADSTRFAMSRTVDDVLLTDTLTFRYTNYPWFESMECGGRVNARLKACTVQGVLFRSAVILDSSVVNTASEHVRLTL